jgi:hypothetical protein
MLSRNPAASGILRLNRNRIQWESLSENPSIFDDTHTIARRVISNNLREAIYNPNTTLGYNRIKRNFERENEELYNQHRGKITPKLYHEVFKSPPPPPKRVKGIQRNPQTLQIETAYHFGKKKVRLNLKQLKKDLILLKK